MKTKMGVVGVSLIVGATVAHIPAILLSLFAGLLDSRPAGFLDTLIIISLIGASLFLGVVAYRWTNRNLMPFIESADPPYNLNTGT